MKKSFSLIEILFVVIIISIISAVVLSKTSSNIQKTMLLKAKSDVILIKSALNQYKNKMLLKQKSSYLSSLDDASINTKGLKLFTNIIKDVIFISTSKEQLKQGLWIKTSNNSYEFVLSSQDQIEFIYDDVNNKFECDLSTQYCDELIQ